MQGTLSGGDSIWALRGGDCSHNNVEKFVVYYWWPKKSQYLLVSMHFSTYFLLPNTDARPFVIATTCYQMAFQSWTCLTWKSEAIDFDKKRYSHQVLESLKSSDHASAPAIAWLFPSYTGKFCHGHFRMLWSSCSPGKFLPEYRLCLLWLWTFQLVKCEDIYRDWNPWSNCQPAGMIRRHWRKHFHY